MSIDVRNTNDIKVVASFLGPLIIRQLEAGKRVLWFTAGRSCTAVAASASHIIAEHPHSNLSVTLTDERYGEVGHTNSNFQQLIDFGFSLPQAKMIPVLDGKNIKETTANFNAILKEELKKADYKIGLFGAGIDGHTAGILPGSEAVYTEELVFDYTAPDFERITITPKTIVQLNEAVVFMQGREKWKVLEDLTTKDIDIAQQPAQILKKIPTLTIFTDKK